jgi:DNA invertase Pin-like site-specific DNA recombinase
MTIRKLKPAIAYTRVSTNGQGDNGIGLEAQSDAISRYAKRKGYEIIDHYRDVASACGPGGLAKRKVLAEAAKQAKSLNATILAHEVDRISRSRKVLEDLITLREVDLETVRNGKIKPDDIDTYGRAAEIVGERISSSTKEALARKKAQGIKLGKARSS